MKYLVLKRLEARREAQDLFLEQVAAGDRLVLPFEGRTEDLDDYEVAEVRADPTTEDLIPSIPFTLVKPVDQPHLDSLAQPAWGIEAVGATASPWDGRTVRVAVIDSGIDRSHPAFSGLLLEDADLVDFTDDEQGVPGAAPDEDGHGTHVAGTIFGRDISSTRIGVARGIEKALIAKVLGLHGAPTETVFNAIEWALRRRADIISMSLGMDFPGLVARLEKEGLPQDIAVSRSLEAYRSNVRLFDRLAAAISARVHRGRGALLVAASGNESRRTADARFTVATAPPAAADGFISVGALSSKPFGVAPFSNTGCIVSAPGMGIFSAKNGGGLTVLSGTSMATPHVTAVLAMWIQKLFPSGDRPNGWAVDVRRALESNTLSLPGQTRNDVGLGLVQAPK